MKAFLTRTFNRRLMLLFVAPHVLFLFIALISRSVHLIGILNTVIFATAIMVVVAYAPVVVDVLLSSREIDRADWLGMGIYLGWFATILLRAYSIVWRILGQPQWLTDSDILSYALFVQMCAAVLHLAAPGAVGHRVPTKRWINIGITVGVLVFMAMLMGYLFNAFSQDIMAIR